ncbi:hypothetical protein GCM10028796_32730 [Ramlibacter monticola]|uniref:Lipoprotein n=1 Tax=Ramlibacter monticola TaxID=1926872 RepID=A0A936Z556_9BURK|nr:hypothetical protein [Ramlibacter monticola]MBL0394154.1 hypothetical protein [Ramlibacter monticola]
MKANAIRFSKFCAGVVLSAAVVACGGGGGESIIDSGISAAMNFLSGGAFKDVDSLVVALDGDNLVIQDFGTSNLGTNPGVLPLGTPLVSGISCDAISCTGQVLSPKFNNGVLENFTRETGTITKQDDTEFVINSASLGAKKYTKLPSGPASPAPQPSPSPSNGGTGSLAASATCEQWWAALVNRKLTWVSANGGPDYPTSFPGATLTFSGSGQDMRWELAGPSFPRVVLGRTYDWLPGRSGTLTLTDKFPTQKLCRFYLSFDREWWSGAWNGIEYVFWAHSLSDGKMRFVLNPDTPNTPFDWVFTVN